MGGKATLKVYNFVGKDLHISDFVSFKFSDFEPSLYFAGLTFRKNRKRATSKSHNDYISSSNASIV